MNITLYGISNCDTIKKAKKWLTQNNIIFSFHDFRKDGIDEALIDQFVTHFDWETLLNKRGTTWRNLDEETKFTLNSTTASNIMLEYPAIIKRPILVSNNGQLLGFSETTYSTFFNL